MTKVLHRCTDTVQSSLASFGLGANLENLTGTATRVQALVGNSLNNAMTGGSGHCSPGSSAETILDPLTGLFGPEYFAAAAQTALAKPQHAGALRHLLLMNLDHFRRVNNSVGMAAGNEILCRVAKRLATAVGKSAILGRIGGDEFAALLPDGADGTAVGGHLLELISRPYAVHGQIIALSASIGSASCPKDGATAEMLMRASSIALDKAKTTGRRQLFSFSPAMRDEAETRLALENDLRSALALERTQLRSAALVDQFALYYQPQVATADGRLTGFEALVRWCHPQRGLLGPSQFIPLAEEIGVIGRLGQWALRTACQAAVGWPVPTQGQPLPVAVNVSPQQLAEGPALIAGIAEILTETGLDPGRLHIEITESALLGDVGAVLWGIKELGVHLSMDDFGSGYSSLGNLVRFPFDQMKMDRDFILALDAAGSGVRMIRAIAALGESLGLGTVSEGVETLAQAALVRAAGVTTIQGYHVSCPIPQDAVHELIAHFDTSLFKSA